MNARCIDKIARSVAETSNTIFYKKEVTPFRIYLVHNHDYIVNKETNSSDECIDSLSSKNKSITDAFSISVHC